MGISMDKWQFRLFLILSGLLIFLGSVLAQSYKIVDTGQSTFYNASDEISKPSVGDSFYGQDAQFEGNQPNYTLSQDGLTVYDNVTGLTWAKSPDLNNNGVISVDDKLTYSEALDYPNTLNSQNFGGYNDWRLPSMKELYSLMNFNGTDPSGPETDGLVPFIDTDYFDFGYGDSDAGERAIDAQFWSTNEYIGKVFVNQNAVFGLNLADGRIKGYPYSGQMVKENYVYFVRGNTDYGINNFTDNSDGTITDNATALMWSQNDFGNGSDTGPRSGLTWTEALEFVQEKNDESYLGYDDWRLPNAKEIQSIVDYSRAPDVTNSGAIDPVFNITRITNEGGEADYPWFWTGTTHLRSNGSAAAAVYICFGRALGYMQNSWIDVHGAGCQRSDEKTGTFSNQFTYVSDGYYFTNSPQGDASRLYNYVRLVRYTEVSDTTGGGDDDGGDIGESNWSESDALLFAPLGNTNTYLIDSEGRVVNSWTSDNSPALSAYLLNDKSLLRTSSLDRNGNTVFGSTGGAGGRVEWYDWDGNKLWEFEHNSDEYLLHHDIEYLPNGNILMVAWEYKTQEEAIEAGRDPSLLSDGELWPDKIIEVQPSGNSGGTIVWEWHVWDHLIQDYDATKENYGTVFEHPEKINLNFVNGQGGADWNHINGIDYNEELDQIIVTVRNFSEIWIIDHNTTTSEAAGSAGDLLYRWGNPQTYDRGTSEDQKLFGPHDGQWIKSDYPGENDILIFNNGQGRNYSSIDQISPPINAIDTYFIQSESAFGPEELTWTYFSDPTSDFYADHISGTQRLPNGNTLICEGTEGRFFEVTDGGDIVWEYFNPYIFETPQGNEVKEVFRATLYNLDELDGDQILTDVEETSGLPTEISLNQNYPNPFNPSTTISFALPSSVNVSLRIYNSLGQLVTTLVDQILSSGNHIYEWNANNLASGVYIYNLSVDGKSIGIKKMMLLK